MEAALFIFSLIDCCALIFLSVYFIITLSDLECDYINARSCCSKLNKIGPAFINVPDGLLGLLKVTVAVSATTVIAALFWVLLGYYWIVPELIAHTLVTVLMLVSLHWFIFCLNLPVATWNIYRFIMVPSGNLGVFDPTEIHNRGQLKSHMKEAMIKLGFHLLCFFIYLYSMIFALLNN